MKKLLGSLAASTFALGAQADPAAQPPAAAQPTAVLSVAFVAPQDYTDVAYSRAFAGERDRARVTRDIERHLQQLAAHGLAPGCTLRIDILDIDLAGHFEPWRFRDSDLRVMRDVTWPRMRLRYELARDGQVLASTEERLADRDYLAEPNRYAQGDPLRYEKAMLDRWFEEHVTRVVSH